MQKIAKYLTSSWLDETIVDDSGKRVQIRNLPKGDKRISKQFYLYPFNNETEINDDVITIAVMNCNPWFASIDRINHWINRVMSRISVNKNIRLKVYNIFAGAIPELNDDFTREIACIIGSGGVYAGNENDVNVKAYEKFLADLHEYNAKITQKMSLIFRKIIYFIKNDRTKLNDLFDELEKGCQAVVNMFAICSSHEIMATSMNGVVSDNKNFDYAEQSDFPKFYTDSSDGGELWNRAGIYETDLASNLASIDESTCRVKVGQFHSSQVTKLAEHPFINVSTVGCNDFCKHDMIAYTIPIDVKWYKTEFQRMFNNVALGKYLLYFSMQGHPEKTPFECMDDFMSFSGDDSQLNHDMYEWVIEHMSRMMGVDRDELLDKATVMNDDGTLLGEVVFQHFLEQRKLVEKMKVALKF